MGKTVFGSLFTIMSVDLRSGNVRDMVKTFKFISTITKELKLPYAVAGAVALSMYAKPRNTEDVDVIVFKSDKKKLLNYFDEKGIVYDNADRYQVTVKAQKGITDIDILFGFAGPEVYAIDSAVTMKIAGIPLRVISPEALLWMYLSSDLAKHKVDAINLLRSGKVNTWKLINELEDEDPFLIDILKEWVAEANKVESSYDDAIYAREKRLGRVIEK